MNRSFLLLTVFSLYAVSTLVSMAAMSICAALLFLTVAVDSNTRQALIALFQTSALKKYKTASLLFTGALVLSLLTAAFFPLTFNGVGTAVLFPGNFVKLWYFAWPFAVAALFTSLSSDDQKKALQIYVAAFAVLCVVGVLQFFTGWPRPQPIPTLPGFFHATLFLGHHLSVASIFIFGFFFSFGQVFVPPFRALKRNQALVATFLGAIVLFLGFSRSLWVALPIGVLFVLLASLKSKTKAFGILFFIALCFAVVFRNAILLRLENPMGIHDRLELWSANLAFFKARPFTGVGFGHSQELAGHYFRFIHPEQKDFFIGHAHNLYLELLSGMGLIGFATFFIWAKEAVTLLKQVFSKPALLGVVAVFLINALTQVNFFEAKVLHQIMLWLGIGMALEFQKVKNTQ